MKNEVYSYRGREFKYKAPYVSMVAKATDDEYNDNKEYQKEHGRNLWDIDEDGYIEIEKVGLMKENWDNSENRDVYLDQWIDEYEEECRCLIDQFTKYELPLIQSEMA